jgi:UbiD family decarboxylase
MAKNVRDTVFAYKDLRDWLVEADRLGELTTVTGLNTEEDIGLASGLVMQEESANCVLFDEIPGHEKGFRVLVNFFGGTRGNMTMGFPANLTRTDLSHAYYQHQIKDLNTIPHKIVEDGPVMENIMEGDDVDLDLFPAPLWHAEDGGVYIGTGSYNVTRDPDTDVLNIGADRVMLHDRKTVGYTSSPGTHGRGHRDKYFARGEPMPACIVIGGDPMTYLNAGAEMPSGVCDYDMVGGLRGAALDCIRGKHTGLPFPADAEIVLEGFVDPVERRAEGPFGEWTGYYDSDVRPEPVMHVKAVYYRNDPIILGCPPQRPPDEMCRYRAVTRSAMLHAAIEEAGVPDVDSAWAHEIGNSRLLLAVAIKQRYPGHARQAGHVAAMCHIGAYAGRYVIVTEEDVDISNLGELTWAMLTRSDPGTSIDIITDALSTPMDPRIAPEDKAMGNFTNSRAIIDACRPFHWKDDFPPVNAPSPEVARKAREKFGYLLDGEDSP